MITPQLRIGQGQRRNLPKCFFSQIESERIELWVDGSPLWVAGPHPTPSTSSRLWIVKILNFGFFDWPSKQQRVTPAEFTRRFRIKIPTAIHASPPRLLVSRRLCAYILSQSHCDGRYHCAWDLCLCYPDWVYFMLTLGTLSRRLELSQWC